MWFESKQDFRYAEIVVNHAAALRLAASQEGDMARLGRRKLADHERRTAATLNVRLNEHELKTIEGKARQAGVTPTQWARFAALERDPPQRRIIPPLNQSAWLELSKLTATLNSAVWRFRPGSEQALSTLFEIVQHELASVRSQLVGDTK